MPWSTENSIPSIQNKSKELRALFAKVANEALTKGQTEEEAVFAGLSAVRIQENKNKPKVKKSIKPEIPSHLKFIIENHNKPKEVEVEKKSEGSKVEPKIRKEFLGANAIESDSTRSLVSARWDDKGRLILQFDDGEKITTSPVPIQERIEQYIGITSGGVPEVFDHIQFNVESVSEILMGRLVWNPDMGTLELGMGHNGVTQSIGLETYFSVKNQNAFTLTDGMVVMASGAVGNSGRILASPAVASVNIPPIRTLGVVTHDIETGVDGYATHFGLVKGINTTGSDVGETWVDGDILYVHPSIPGKMTNIPPVAPVPKITVAMVIHSHQNGQIFVRPTFGESLGGLHDVQIDSPQNGQILKYDGATGTWKNVNPAAASGVTTSSYFTKISTLDNTPYVVNHGMSLVDKDAFTINTILDGEMVEVAVVSIDQNSLAIITTVATTDLSVSIIGIIA